MPIDLYKTLGYDYRDKTREAKLAVDSDVERAKRLAEVEREAAAQRSQQMEGIARRRFVENYAKTLEAGGQKEGLGEDAEAAWAKKVASGDLGDVMKFEEMAGAMPHIRDLAKEKIQADQQDVEVRKEENKSKMMSLISLVGAMVGMGGAGGIEGGAGGGGGGGLLKSLSGSKSTGSELEKIAGDKLKAGGAQSRAAFSLAEKEAAENAALTPNAGARVLTQAEQAEKDRELRLAGQKLSNQNAQNAVDLGRLELFNADVQMPLRNRLLELQVRQAQGDASVQDEINQTKLQLMKEQAARYKRMGQPLNFNLSGQPLATPANRELTADDLDFGSSLR